MSGELRLIIVSGLSGSGKSVALHVLEDLGYYCIDNLPAGLLMSAVEEVRRGSKSSMRLAVGVDARNHAQNLDLLPDLLRKLQKQGIDTDIIFLHANDATLLQRYRESRRRHPLAEEGTQLRAAIQSERAILAEIELSADLIIDTSATSMNWPKPFARAWIGAKRRPCRYSSSHSASNTAFPQTPTLSSTCAACRTRTGR